MPPQDETYAADEVVTSIRARIVDFQLAEILAAARKSEPSWRSALLAVAQFWNDEADDEVHAGYVLSEEARAEWPAQQRYDQPLTGWPKDALIPVFEVFCAERVEYPDNPYEGISDWFPVAHAFVDGDSITSERVWNIQRAWLDMPRERPPELPQLDANVVALLRDPTATSVIRDALLERSDPRGELMAGTIAHDEQLARAWLGSLEPHVPRAGVRFVDGIPRSIDLWFDLGNSLADLDRDDPLPWACAPRITFTPDSARPILPGMTRASALDSLGVRELEALAAFNTPLACTALAVDFEWDNADECVRALRALSTPNLHTLTVCAPFTAIDVASWARLAPQITLASDFDDDSSHLAAVEACAKSGAPLRLAMIDPDTLEVGGWIVDFAGGARTITRRGFSRVATRERYAALIR